MKEEIAEIAGMEIIGPQMKIEHVQIRIGNFVLPMDEIDLKKVDMNRIDLEKAIIGLIARERIWLASHEVMNSTEKAIVAIKRLCYKDKNWEADEEEYWIAGDWFRRMENE